MLDDKTATVAYLADYRDRARISEINSEWIVRSTVALPIRVRVNGQIVDMLSVSMSRVNGDSAEYVFTLEQVEALANSMIAGVRSVEDRQLADLVDEPAGETEIGDKK